MRGGFPGAVAVFIAGCAVDDGGAVDCALDDMATARPTASKSARGR